MRFAVILLALVLAGCNAPAAEEEPLPAEDASPTPDATPPRTVAPSRPPASPTPAPSPTSTASPVVPLETPRAPEPATLRFALRADRTIARLLPGETMPTEERVEEPVSGADFAAGLPQGLAFAPFVSMPMSEALEIVEDFTLTMRFVARAPAVATLPSEAGAPTIGVWFGTPDRAIAFLTTDVPTMLPPDEVQTLALTVPVPEGGILLRAGEAFEIRTYLSYQTSDGSKVEWLVGGEAPAGFEIPALPVDLGATAAAVVLDETGDDLPSPAFTANDPQPHEFAFDVPAGTTYLVAQLVGTPTAGATMDMDLTLLVDDEVVAGSYGPYAREGVVLGPGALAALDATSMTARIATGTSPSGGTYEIVVTAYVAT